LGLVSFIRLIGLIGLFGLWISFWVGENKDDNNNNNEEIEGKQSLSG
jgi:hypothetical protein